jgi:hypothetical protein
LKSTTRIILSTATFVLTGTVWIVASRDNAGHTVADKAPQAVSAAPALVTAGAVELPTTVPTVAGVAAIVAADVEPVPVPAATAVVPADRVAADGSIKHIARPGDTVSGLAEDILGRDTPANRTAIVNANSSLKADPDKLLAGKAYRIPSPEQVAGSKADTVVIPPAVPVIVAAPTQSTTPVESVPAEKAPAEKAPAENAAAAKPSSAEPDADQIVADAAPRMLRYTAREGDTVTTLATQLLGSDTQEARDAIIKNNPSLKRNPDHLVAGQTYWIPSPATATAAGN